MNPEALLAETDRLLSTAVAHTHGRWPRTSALLIRYALEQALHAVWARVEPSAAEAPMRAQLLILPSYADPDVALTARQAWTGLARAAHHHAYELAPTAGELRAWHDLVHDLIGHLATSQDPPRGRTQSTER